MDDVMTKEKILQRITSERGKLDGTLSRLSARQMAEEEVEAGWTVKDILAHITVWERRMLRWMNETLDGIKPDMLPDGMTWDDLDRWNEETYLEDKNRPLKEILLEYSSALPKILEIVEKASEEELISPERFAWRKGTPLWEMVASNTFWHYGEHREQIEGWLIAKN
jgi:hypothetical protein